MDSIERLKKVLYSREGKGLGARKRRGLREYATEDVQEDWVQESPNPQSGKQKDRILVLTLVFSVLFFVFSLGVAAFLFFADQNIVSSGNIDIGIQGPANIGGGEELVLQFAITNNNPTGIKNVDLLVEYPEGTRTAHDLSQELLRTREALGVMRAGERIQKTARARLFGEEGEVKQIKAIIEYRVEGSNAIFSREQIYEVVLSNSPLVITVEGVDEVSSGQEVEFSIRVNSNSENILEDILLIAEYPFGFEFLTATPSTFAKNNVWELGDIKPEESKTIKIRGRILGEDAEERVFRFRTGVRSATDDTKIETAFITALHSIVVEKPFIGVRLAVNGNTNTEPVISRADRVRVDTTWFNNLSDRVFDGEIEIRLSGAILDERSVSVQNGFYRSSDNTVIWDRDTLPSLGSLGEGAQGTVSFSFLPIPFTPGESFRTPSIFLDVTIRGRRVSENNVSESVESTIRRVIKVTTGLSMSARGAYTSGPFQNTGPIPPRAEQETTYTVFWTAENTTNPVGNAVAVGTLPSYVRWVGAIDPSTAQVDFNEVGGRITWNIGALGSYESRQVAFQVALMPSLSQVGLGPTLVHTQNIRGIDTFTTQTVGVGAQDVTTFLTGDSGFPSQNGQVTE